jgi:hypothetical protein
MNTYIQPERTGGGNTITHPDGPSSSQSEYPTPADRHDVAEKPRDSSSSAAERSDGDMSGHGLNYGL